MDLGGASHPKFLRTLDWGFMSLEDIARGEVAGSDTNERRESRDVSIGPQPLWCSGREAHLVRPDGFGGVARGDARGGCGTPTPGAPVAACDATVAGACYVNGSFGISVAAPFADHVRVVSKQRHEAVGADATWGVNADPVLASIGGTKTFVFIVSGLHFRATDFVVPIAPVHVTNSNNCTPVDEQRRRLRENGSHRTDPSRRHHAVSCNSHDDERTAGRRAVSWPASAPGHGRWFRHRRVPGLPQQGHDRVGRLQRRAVVERRNLLHRRADLHLPSDGYRRAYYFRARDGLGNWSAWNSPRYVRVDRHDPTISASNSSTNWSTNRVAVVSAADSVAGAAANAGLDRSGTAWRMTGSCWTTTPSRPSAATGTPASSGAALAVAEGDLRLYLCARDRVGRTSHWSGRYRVYRASSFTLSFLLEVDAELDTRGVEPGESVPLGVHLQRTDGFTDPVSISLSGLPPDIHVGFIDR